jgi:hypothetical protein
MRYYKITFKNPDGSKIRGVNQFFPDSISSHSDEGIYNPGALEVEFEIANAWGHNLAAQTHLRIHNPTLQMVQNSQQYNGSICEIRAGFMQGLPLANPNQAGVIGYGRVQNTFANWLGTDLVLDFIIYPSSSFGSPDLIFSANTGPGSAISYPFKWTQGSILDAIKATFSPLGMTIKGSVSDKLNNPPLGGVETWLSNYQSFAEFMRGLSISIINPPSQQTTGTGTNQTATGQGQWQNYLGVQMFWIPNNNEIYVWDGTVPAGAIELKYEEFIGQPTWLSVAGFLQSVHPMRSDISLGFNVKYPQSIPTQANPSQIAVRDTLVSPSSGLLFVQQVRHVGRFRDTSPTGWVTYIDAGRNNRENPWEPQGQVTVGELTPA